MPSTRTSARILVIEDDRGIATGLRALLASRGYEVDLAAGPETAIRQASRGRYELVVADFDLGDQDGRDVVRRLRWMRPELPVLAVTAVDRSDAEADATALGVIECFEKPVDPEELVLAVDRCVHRPQSSVIRADPR